MLILDVGAKYGIHPSFRDIKNLYKFLLVDADPQEIINLKKLYKKNKNIKCKNFFFDKKNKDKSVYLNIYKHQGKHSFYELINEKIQKKLLVPLATIDSIKEKIVFLKVDVEGKEVDCLLGATNQLSNNILGIRCEVLLNPIYKNQTETFSKVNSILQHFDFEFMNFDILRKTSFKPFYKYYDKDSAVYGKVFAVDGIWVKKVEKILKSADAKEILNYVLFCLLNNLTDLAIKILKSKKNLINKSIKKNQIYKKIFYFIEYRLANIFFYLRKDSLYTKVIEKDFEDIFYKKFPLEGNFFKQYTLDFKF
jgi:FkbM family methyltransferase